VLWTENDYVQRGRMPPKSAGYRCGLPARAIKIECFTRNNAFVES